MLRFAITTHTRLLSIFASYYLTINLRYFLKFSYNGTNYHGWQSQPNAITVQATLEKALSVILSSEIETIGAGRTDTGVHAKEMYAHFDSNSYFEIAQTVYKLNSFLPKDIAISDIYPVHDDAHARFDASERTYVYKMHTNKDVFLENLSWQFPQTLDIENMNVAANELLRHTNFECFSKVNTDVNTFNCNITHAFWEQKGSTINFKITANRFLRNMVRAIVGTLINVGTQKITIPEFVEIINSRDRKKAGISVPAHGLYLTNITYDYLK